MQRTERIAPGPPRTPDPGQWEEIRGPENGESPSIEEYIAVALQNNAGLRAAFEQWLAAVERAPQVRSLPDPQFTYTHFIEEIQTRTGPQNNRFQLSQQFPWFSKLRRRGAAASEHAESLWWSVEAQALALTKNVKVAYSEYAYLAKAIRIMQENLSLLRNLEPIVQRRVQTGASQGALLRLQVEIGKVENDLATLRDRRPAISARLGALLNRRRSDPLPWPEPSEPDTTRYRLEDLRGAVLEENPELKSLQFRVREAEERTALARLEAYPDFMVGVSFIETGEAVTPIRPSDSGDDPVSVSIGFSVPIWPQKYSAAKREALAEQRASEWRRIQSENDLVSDLEMSLYGYDDAVRQLSFYRDTLIPRGRQALEVTEVSYESGRSTLLDVIDSQRDLLNFELSYWRAVTDYDQRLAEIEALCGGSLP